MAGVDGGDLRLDALAVAAGVLHPFLCRTG
jgi:hypothetical protein